MSLFSGAFLQAKPVHLILDRVAHRLAGRDRRPAAAALRGAPVVPSACPALGRGLATGAASNACPAVARGAAPPARASPRSPPAVPAVSGAAATRALTASSRIDFLASGSFVYPAGSAQSDRHFDCRPKVHVDCVHVTRLSSQRSAVSRMKTGDDSSNSKDVLQSNPGAGAT